MTLDQPECRSAGSSRVVALANANPVLTASSLTRMPELAHSKLRRMRRHVCSWQILLQKSPTRMARIGKAVSERGTLLTFPLAPVARAAGTLGD